MVALRLRLPLFWLFVTTSDSAFERGEGCARTRDVRLFPRFTRPSIKSGVDCDRFGYFLLLVLGTLE
eukprot:UN02651